MAITQRLLVPNVPPRPARVLDCLMPNIDNRCGWRCCGWETVIRLNRDRGGTQEHRAAIRRHCLYFQLCAELCEATPDLRREVVKEALWNAGESDLDELAELGKRARFMLTTDPSQQAIAASMLGDFVGTSREFASTVRAMGAPVITCRGMNPDLELAKLPR